MHSTTYDGQSKRIIHPHEQSIQHQQHASHYRCAHRNNVDQKSRQIPNFPLHSIVDYPHVLLNDQHIRDLTDVYRREKDFLVQRSKSILHNDIFNRAEENVEKEMEESESKYDAKEYDYHIPCNCETSLPGKILQGFFNRVKMSMEFFLFMGYVIGRRNELLESHYPFDRHRSHHCQVNHNYPFVRRSTYSNEMKKLNTIRDRLNRKPSSMKHTTTRTYYDIH